MLCPVTELQSYLHPVVLNLKHILFENIVALDTKPAFSMTHFQRAITHIL